MAHSKSDESIKIYHLSELKHIDDTIYEQSDSDLFVWLGRVHLFHLLKLRENVSNHPSRIVDPRTKKSADTDPTPRDVQNPSGDCTHSNWKTLTKFTVV